MVAKAGGANCPALGFLCEAREEKNVDHGMVVNGGEEV